MNKYKLEVIKILGYIRAQEIQSRGWANSPKFFGQLDKLIIRVA